MRALVITCRDPFRPAHHRDVAMVRRRRRLRALAPRTRQPFICLVNGRPVMRAAWNMRVRQGDAIVFVILPQGGGGGGSNPLAAVLQIALLVFAPGIAGAIYNGLFAAGVQLGTMGLSMIKAAVGLIGSALINAVLPPPRQPAAAQAQALAAPSPTYMVGAQGNTARIGQPIPVLYGRHRIYPDYAAMPYLEFGGNEQYLYVLLVITQGACVVEQIMIGDAEVASFAEVTCEIVPPGGVVTLFPASVVTAETVSGQEAAGMVAGTYSQAGAVITVTQADHGRAVGQAVSLLFTSGVATSGAFSIATIVDANRFTVTAAGSFATSGAVSVRSILGGINGFPACDAGSLANALAVDVVFPRGLYMANDSGGIAPMTVTWMVEAQPIDDFGVPVGDWIELAAESFTAATMTPQRLTMRYGVAASRYQVRLTRTDAKQTDYRCGHEIDWVGLRAYLPGSQQYGNVTLLAMRMRASGNLSQQSSRRVSVIATRMLPTWDPAHGWSEPVATRSIAAAFADACRNSDYGAGLQDSRIDLAALHALDNTWTARGDTFDAVSDSQGTVWETLTNIARAGRAQPYMQGGVVHCVRDQAAALPVAMYGPRNILRNSLKLQYVMPTEASPDAVVVTYWDSVVWSWRQVPCALPDSTSVRPAQVTLFGVVSRDQAWREGLYMAACNRYRRRLGSLDTEMEGFIPSLGDLVAISHDLPKWGQYGDIVAWDPATSTATTSEPLDWSAGGAFSFAFRQRDGSPAGPYAATMGPDAHRVILGDWDGATDPTPDTGMDRERSHYAFGPAGAQYIAARVAGVHPLSAETARIEFVVESDFVHVADTGVAPDPSAWQLPFQFDMPVVTGLVARPGPPDQPFVALLSWQSAPGADHYLVEQGGGDDTWTRCGEVSACNISVMALFGPATIFRVAGVGAVVGPWAQVFFGPSGGFMWSSDSALMWTSDATLMWTS